MAKQADSRGWLGYLTALFFLSLSLLAVKEMRLGTASFAVQDPMEAAVHSLTFPDRKQRLRDSYTGIVGLDFGLRYLVSAFLPGVAGWDKGFQIQQIYFLISVFTIISIWSVEAGRKRNSIALTSLYVLIFSPVPLPRILLNRIHIQDFHMGTFLSNCWRGYYHTSLLSSIHERICPTRLLVPSVAAGTSPIRKSAPTFATHRLPATNNLDVSAVFRS